jgi:short-subunit dehydrogenase
MTPQTRMLDGNVAVVTGGGTGLGAAIALALAREGAGLHLIGRRLEVLQSVAARASEMGVSANCHSADLSIASNQRELSERLKRNLPHLDFLILSAAMHSMGPIEDSSLAQFDQLYHTNVRAPYALAQSLLPMLKERRGQIVFINSSSGVSAKPMFAQYDATKHALKAIADSLRGEVNRFGVRVVSVYPGRTATEMQEQLHGKEGKPYRPELLLQPTDVASAIMNALLLPRTAEVTDIHIRPMIKS